MPTAGYVLVTTVLAVLVYERVGVGELRRAWVNLDLAWTGALVITALALARFRGTELGVP